MVPLNSFKCVVRLGTHSSAQQYCMHGLTRQLKFPLNPSVLSGTARMVPLHVEARHIQIRMHGEIRHLRIPESVSYA